jgi:flagellar biogenesis protein FliO
MKELVDFAYGLMLIGALIAAMCLVVAAWQIVRRFARGKNEKS